MRARAEVDRSIPFRPRASLIRGVLEKEVLIVSSLQLPISTAESRTEQRPPSGLTSRMIVPNLGLTAVDRLCL